MSNSNSLYRKDLIAAVWSISFAAFGLLIAIAAEFHTSKLILLLFAALGIIAGQFLARRWFKHRSPAREEEFIRMDSVLKISVWAMSCIGLGLFLAYLDNKPIAGIVTSGTIMAAIVAASFASSMFVGYIERQDGKK